MNVAVISGRLTRDPEGRASQTGMTVARYTLAVDRYSRGEKSADFINVIAFDKRGEFAEKYFRKGMLVIVSGRIQTGSYENKEGHKVNTFEIVAENQEFGESKKAEHTAEPKADDDGFMSVDEGLDTELPFA